jgi:hypothetical protein
LLLLCWSPLCSPLAEGCEIQDPGPGIAYEEIFLTENIMKAQRHISFTLIPNFKISMLDSCNWEHCSIATFPDPPSFYPAPWGWDPETWQWVAWVYITTDFLLTFEAKPPNPFLENDVLSDSNAPPCSNE